MNYMLMIELNTIEIGRLRDLLQSKIGTGSSPEDVDVDVINNVIASCDEILGEVSHE